MVTILSCHVSLRPPKRWTHDMMRSIPRESCCVSWVPCWACFKTHAPRTRDIR